MGEKAIRQYLWAAKKEVRCSTKRKRAFLTELETGLRELAQETPDLTMAYLTDAFGTPQQQAQDFMETLNVSEIKRAFTWKKAVVIGLIAALLIWVIAVVTLWIDGHAQNHGHGEEYLGNSIVSIEEY